jgi:hypothetical protein
MGNPFANPFPGMNPYLEAVPWWREVHNTLISEIRFFLLDSLPIEYSVSMEERVVIVRNPPEETRRRYAIPDITISGRDFSSSDVDKRPNGQAITAVLPDVYPARERFIEIRMQNRNAAVAIIEILSPSNKNRGRDRDDYISKRERILNSSTHLLEIDLLRGGDPMPIKGYEGDAPYRIMLSRHELRPSVDLYVFDLQSSIPQFAVPLSHKDDEPVLDLGYILDDIYQRSYYARGLDYSLEPHGPISSDDREWLDQLLRSKSLRA